MEILFVSYIAALLYIFFFKQKTAYEMRISDWSSDVCSSDLAGRDTSPAWLRLQRGGVRWGSLMSSFPNKKRPRRTALNFYLRGRYLALMTPFHDCPERTALITDRLTPNSSAITLELRPELRMCRTPSGVDRTSTRLNSSR